MAKSEFTKNWGKRKLEDNWRVSSISEKKTEKIRTLEDLKIRDKDAKDNAAVDEKYTPDFYIKQIPGSQKVIDSLSKERNFANYQLGNYL